MSYVQKYIRSGKYLEVYDYPHLVVSGKKRKHSTKKKKDCADKKPSRTDSVARTRLAVSRLVNSNSDLINFVTLTNRPDMVDLREANIHFHNFIKRLKRKYSALKYLAVPEFQNDYDYYGKIKPLGGSVHYHLLINIKYIPSKELEKIWTLGFVKINRSKRIKNVGFYISKYIGKALFDKRYFGMRKILYSSNLLRPIIETSRVRISDAMLSELPNFKSIHKKTYKSEYHGEIACNMLEGFK